MALKKLLFIFVLFTIPSYFSGATRHQVFLDLGGLQPLEYFYPVMNFGYGVQDPFEVRNLSIKTTIRSYGTLYLVNIFSYDFTGIADYSFYLVRETAGINISAVLGFGGELRLRLVKDPRSQETTSFEPILETGLNFKWYDFDLETPVYERFYSDGLSVSMRPEFGWNFSRWKVFWRSEVTWLWRYADHQSAWNWDNYLGIVLFWGHEY